MTKKTEATCVNRPIKSDMYQKTVQEVNYIRFKTSIVRIKSFKRVLNANIAIGNKSRGILKDISTRKTTRLKVYVAIKRQKVPVGNPGKLYKRELIIGQSAYR